MISILGIVATVLSVVGYLIVSNIKASTSLKIWGFYIRFIAAVMFTIYTVIRKDYSVFILTLFYAAIDVYNLYNLINIRNNNPHD
jgi:drug/metabolite transporter (DMT)-like permease